MHSVYEDLDTLRLHVRIDAVPQVGDVAMATEADHHLLGQPFQLLLVKERENKDEKKTVVLAPSSQRKFFFS